MEFEVKSNIVKIESKGRNLFIEFLKNDSLRIYFEKVNEELFSIYPKKDTSKYVVKKRDGKIIITLNKNKSLVVDASFNISLNDYLTLSLSEKVIDDKKAYSTNFKISDDARVMGLGDKMAALDKRGYHFRSWATDDPTHQDELYPSLYKAISYLFINSNNHYFALYFPSTYPYDFDIDHNVLGEVDVYSFEAKHDFFLFYGDTPKAIISSYSSLVGHPYMPRLKMLGNQQSRWSYENEKQVMDVYHGYQNNELPIDYIHLDIAFMDGYRCFTVDKNSFPDLKKLSSILKEDNIELVAINDAGIKVDDNYPLYQHLIKNDEVIKNSDDSTYIGKVWPGEAIFPNYFDTKVKKYFADEAYKFIKDNGITGIWNDMNEPTSFLGELPLDSYQVYNHRKITHLEGHNVYGEHMVRCFVDTFTRDNLRPYIISRSASATTAQYSIVWGGDNFSVWHHLKLSIPQLLSLSMSNFMFAGVDIGGFGMDTNKQLLIRWCEGNILMPFFRNHSNIVSKPQEPYAFDEECLSIYRKYLNIRYNFIPYLYDLVRKMNTKGEPIVRPLFYNYPEDKIALDINDEYMVGENVLMAPIVNKDETKRIVYLPKGKWIDYFSGRTLRGNRHYMIDYKLDETGIYIKENSIIPQYENLLHLEKEKIDMVTFKLYANKGKYQMYEDDGKSLNYLKDEYNLYDISFNKEKFELKVKHQGYHSSYRRIKVIYKNKTYEIEFKGEDIVLSL